MEDEERTGIVILFHKIFTFINFTHLELFKEGFLEGSILDETGESEVGFETFKDKGFVSGCFFLIYKSEVLVYLTVIALDFDWTELSCFSFTLLKEKFFFVSLEFKIPQGTESSLIISYALHSL